jgi:hypothetical protein
LKTGLKKIPGSVLLSHPAARAVPSALKGLTSVFEMGTGVAPSPLPPGKDITFNSVFGVQSLEKNDAIQIPHSINSQYKNKYGAEENIL